MKRRRRHCLAREHGQLIEPVQFRNVPLSHKIITSVESHITAKIVTCAVAEGHSTNEATALGGPTAEDKDSVLFLPRTGKESEVTESCK